jgi:uncharacterized membrane protein YgcG
MEWMAWMDWTARCGRGPYMQHAPGRLDPQSRRDGEGLCSAGTRTGLERKLADFETKTTGQLVVVTVKSLQGTSIEDYGYQLGRHWQIGQKEKNTGALLIVAPNERKVRIEVGYGFEGTLTDAVSKLIIENSIIPRLRVNDFAGGIGRGVDDISPRCPHVARGRPDRRRARRRQRKAAFRASVQPSEDAASTAQGRGDGRASGRGGGRGGALVWRRWWLGSAYHARVARSR